MLWTLAVLTMGVSQTAEVKCTRDNRGYCTDRMLYVEMGAEPADVYIKANTALGDVFTIRFPDGVSIAEAGVELGNPAVFEVDRRGGKVLVRPKVPDNAQVGAQELLNERTNLQIETERGWRISLDLRQWYPSQSMQSLVFVSKEIDKQEKYIAARVTRALKEQEASLQEERDKLNELVEQRAILKMAEDVLMQNSCDNWGRGTCQPNETHRMQKLVNHLRCCRPNANGVNDDVGLGLG